MAKSRYENVEITNVNGKQMITSLNANINRNIDLSNIKLRVVQIDGSQRLDQIAYTYLGDAKYYWLIMKLNNIWNFWRIASGAKLIVPERESLKELLDYF
jgi:hypothetical protein